MNIYGQKISCLCMDLNSLNRLIDTFIVDLRIYTTKEEAGTCHPPPGQRCKDRVTNIIQ